MSVGGSQQECGWNSTYDQADTILAVRLSWHGEMVAGGWQRFHPISIMIAPKDLPVCLSLTEGYPNKLKAKSIKCGATSTTMAMAEVANLLCPVPTELGA